MAKASDEGSDSPGRGGLFAQVAFNLGVRREFTYAVPESLEREVRPGRRVRAPIHGRERTGTVVALSASTNIPLEKIKAITEVLDQGPRITDEILALCEWAADYYRAPLGEVTAAAFPFSQRATPRLERYIALARPPEEIQRVAAQFPKKWRKRAKVLETMLHSDRAMRRVELREAAGVGDAVIRALISDGYLSVRGVESIRKPDIAQGVFTYPKPELTSHQKHCLTEILRDVHDQSAGVFMLHGVTGSGKTEIYLRAIEQVVAKGGSALVLVPEISLTPQAADRYRSRLGDGVGVFHSGLGQGERFDQWHECLRGNIRVLIGTRSAVFTPLEDLRLLVVDEEHDASLKQVEPPPRYHGRDVAIVRAKAAGATTVLGSATPSLESYHHARRGKYRLLELPHRVSTHGLPRVHLVDMRGRGQREWILSRELREALADRLDRKEQAILFLNRRGYFTSLICRRCGHLFTCENCSVALVYHHYRQRLICHHCDFDAEVPRECPHCKATIISQRGFGTEQVVSEVETLFPGAKLERMDLDTTRRKGSHQAILTRFQEGKVDVLIGTQMITKGLDVPRVTLVGVVNADVALTIPDFRAGERTFALLTQVAGRAGRGTERGEVYVQTHSADHHAVRLALQQDYRGFFARETQFRERIEFPPYSRLINIRVESKDNEVAEKEVDQLGRMLRETIAEETDEVEPVRAIGPTPCPFMRLRGWYRHQVTLQAKTHRAMAKVLDSEKVKDYLEKSHNQFKIIVDVDPASML
jgi:primosomal protein N' (replication factor Y)